jgi:hypothetical protein
MPAAFAVVPIFSPKFPAVTGRKRLIA